MSGQKTAMASRRSGSPCAGNARKKKALAYKAHFNPRLGKGMARANGKKATMGIRMRFVAFVVANLAFILVSQKRTRSLL